MIKGDYTEVIKKEIILEKCDQWLALFKEAYKVYKELAAYPAWVKCKVFPKIKVYNYWYSGGPNGKAIELILDDVISTVEFYVGDNNKDVFNYVIASVVDYYLKEEMSNKQIDMFAWDWDLYTQRNELDNEIITSTAMLKCCTEWKDSKKIITDVINYHNLGKHSDDLLNTLKNNIQDQPLVFCFDSRIETSKIRYLCTKQVLDREKEKNAKVMKKTFES